MQPYPVSRVFAVVRVAVRVVALTVALTAGACSVDEDSGSPSLEMFEVSRDGDTVLLADYDGNLFLWPVAESPPVEVWATHWAASLAMAPGGSRFFSGGEHGDLRIWDRKGRQLAEVLAACPEAAPRWVMALAVSPDGGHVASTGAGGCLRLWTRDGEAIWTRSAHESIGWDVEWLPDGEHLVSAGDDGLVRLWRLGGGPGPRLLQRHQGAVWDVAISPDGRFLAAAGEEGVVRLGSTEGTTGVRSFAGHGHGVSSLDFSPDGVHLASVGQDGGVRLWNLDGTLAASPFPGCCEKLKTELRWRDDRTLLVKVDDRIHVLSRSLELRGTLFFRRGGWIVITEEGVAITSEAFREEAAALAEDSPLLAATKSVPWIGMERAITVLFGESGS